MFPLMISIAVLIDHPLANGSGGLAQCWKNIAKACLSFEKEIKLHLHFLGAKNFKKNVYPNVSYETHPPLVGTHLFSFLKNQIPDQADLAPLNPWLFASLKKGRYDCVHTTNTFLAFAKTGLLFSKLTQTPLTNSIQTDMPCYTRLYTEKIILNLFKKNWMRHLLLKTLKLPERRYHASVKKLEKYLRQCHFLPLRRGVDKQAFHPRFRDRLFLKKKWDIDPDCFLVLFVGRIDEGKNVMTLALAAKRLLEKRKPIHLLMVGEGKSKKEIQALLGRNVTFLGVIPNEELPPIYASSDLFVFPSQIEVFPNVVLEAKASGLPILMAKEGGAPQVIQEAGKDGLVLETKDPALWADTIENLMEDPERLKSLGAQARSHIEKDWPSWEEILKKDLLPVWQKLASKNVWEKNSHFDSTS